MTYFNPLNPLLYQAIERAGLGEIRVSNEGMGLRWGGLVNSGGRLRRAILFWGETYRICCPYCNDNRYRLGINHQYGQPDPANGTWPMNYLARCFNEQDCLENPNNRRGLADRILGFRNKDAAPWRVNHPTVAVESTGGLVPPGNCLFLRDLPLAHPAVQYLVVERRLSPAVLHKYRLGFCIEPNSQLKVAGWLQNRIIVPIYFRDEFVGWQARYVGTPVDKDTPKYLTMPGLPKSQILYNFDTASKQPYGVLVEGVVDAWSIGDCAMAVLGSKPTEMHYQLLVDAFKGKPIVVAFDGEAWDKTEETMWFLRATNQFSGVVALQLPAGRDPGDYDPVTMNQIIRAQALQQGVRLAA